VFTIIDRYIARLFLGYLAGALVVLTTLFLAIDYMSTTSEFHAPMEILRRYYLYSLPFVIYQMLPVGCMVATVFTLSQMSRSNEITALYSMGIGLFRVSLPILVVVTLVSTFGFILSNRVFPSLAQTKNYIFYVEVKKQPHLYSTIKTNKIWYRSKNILFNIKTISPEKHSAQGMTLYYFDDNWNLLQIITADNVGISGTQWQLNDGTITLFAQESSFPLTQSYSTKTINMGEDVGDLTTTTRSTDVLSLQDLKKFIQKHRDAGLDTMRYEVDYHAKFSFAFTSLVLALVGIPFSVGNGRAGGATRKIGVSVGLAGLYWSAYSSGLTLGQHGVVYPIVGAWGPNVIMATVSGFFLLRSRR
jgi:lipopolysaccharide export system permease protein